MGPFCHVENLSTLCEFSHLLKQQCCAYIYALFGLSDARHGINAIDDLAAASMLPLIERREGIGVFCCIQVQRRLASDYRKRLTPRWPPYRVEVCLQGTIRMKAATQCGIPSQSYLCEPRVNAIDGLDSFRVGNDDLVGCHSHKGS